MSKRSYPCGAFKRKKAADEKNLTSKLPKLTAFFPSSKNNKQETDSVPKEFESEIHDVLLSEEPIVTESEQPSSSNTEQQSIVNEIKQYSLF